MIPLQLLVFSNISVGSSRRTWTPWYQIVRLDVGSLSTSQNMTIRVRSDPPVLLRSAKMHGFGGPYRYQVTISFAWTLEAAPTCRAGRIGLPRHDLHWPRTTVGRYRPCGGALLAPPRGLGPMGGGRLGLVLVGLTVVPSPPRDSPARSPPGGEPENGK